MFSSFRRRQRQPDPVSQVPLQPSPSLPNLSASEQVFTWPDEFVDNEFIRQAAASTPDRKYDQTAERSLPLIPRTFRKSTKSKPVGPISSLYTSGPPPSAFGNWKTSPTPVTRRHTQKRTRALPSFNLMVVGGRGAGKTSLASLILETAEISPSATADQRVAVDRFLHASNRRTRSINKACVEILESRHDRCLLTVIDTPGLDFGEGNELKLSHQLNAIMKYIDTQFTETMKEESKVIRESKGDQHVHGCIYMIDHNTVMTATARKDQSSLPANAKNHSQTTISQNPPDLVPDTSDGDDSDDEGHAQLSISQAELRVIKRLASRVNVIPVIAHADSLTDSKLSRVKDAIRRGMMEIGVGEGVLGHRSVPLGTHTLSVGGTEADTSIQSTESSMTESSFVHDDISSDEEERSSRPVIKLRASRHLSKKGLSRSRSCIRDKHEPQRLDPEEDENLATIRFSAQTLANTELSSLLPFAFIAPESGRRHPDKCPGIGIRRSVGADGDSSSPAASPKSQKRDGYVRPETLNGVFLRKFRWGTVDVLNPEHCDFAALRNTIFSTHFTVLRTHTREVLYEKYRTEKLLARRATENISEEEKHRILKNLGI